MASDPRYSMVRSRMLMRGRPRVMGGPPGVMGGRWDRRGSLPSLVEVPNPQPPVNPGPDLRVPGPTINPPSINLPQTHNYQSQTTNRLGLLNPVNLGLGFGSGRGDPWGPWQDHLQEGFDRINQFYTGQRLPAGYRNPYFTSFLDRAQDSVFSRSGVDEAANKYLEGVLEETPGSNPYLDDTFDRAAERVSSHWGQTALRGINNTFGGAGRTGSDLHSMSLARAGRGLSDSLGQLASRIYGDAYNRDRDRQLSAAGMAPAMVNNDFRRLGLGFDIGSQLQALNDPYAHLSRYWNLMNTGEYFNRGGSNFNFNAANPGGLGVPTPPPGGSQTYNFQNSLRL